MHEIITGTQSAITPSILNIAETLTSKGTLLVKDIASYISTLKSVKTEEPDFTRTADQVIQSGYTLGCHEAGLLLVTLLRAKGEKATFIQVFNKEDIASYELDKPHFLRGHVFVRQKTPSGSRIINSTTGEITDDIPAKYIFGEEGLDAWDIGLRHGFNDFVILFEKTKNKCTATD